MGLGRQSVHDYDAHCLIVLGGSEVRLARRLVSSSHSHCLIGEVGRGGSSPYWLAASGLLGMRFCDQPAAKSGELGEQNL